MPPGLLKSARSCWLRHETARRYELSPQWVNLLAEAGLQAVHWSTLGAAKARDTEIMAHAKANGYVVLTHDLDFSAILAATQGEKPSVAQIRAEDLSLDVIGKHVIAALLQMTSELEEGALLTIDPNRVRLRVLPLQSKTEG